MSALTTSRNASSNLSTILLLSFACMLLGAPAAMAQLNFDNDAYGTLIEDAKKRIEEMKKARIQRDADLIREDAEAKEEEEARRKRPVFGSQKVESVNDDDDDSEDNKIFDASVKKRDQNRSMHVTLKLDVDDNDQLESMKSDSTEKDDEERAKEEADKEREEEEKKLAKRKTERKEAFDDLVDKAYFSSDWVPSDYDPLSNGGFGVDDGNGRPVPYHLNGHPNLQRGMPWDLDD